MEHDTQQPVIVLPDSVVSPTDVARLLREINSIELFFKSASIRKPGQSSEMPRVSKLMDKFSEDNQLNLLQAGDRAKIQAYVQKIHDSAPVMHISFSADPPGAYVQKIVAWLRKNIHVQALVKVGLQPNIGAGCIVRTNNKVFDFSLRKYFTQKKGFFVDKLHEAVAVNDQPAQPQQPTVQTPSVESAPQPPAQQQPEAAA